MARSMALDVMVRLRDNLSGPLRRLRNNLRGIADFGRRLGIVGAAVAGISFLGPIQQAAAFQQQLLDIAGTAELSGAKAFAFVAEARTQYEDLALAIGQHSDTIAQGAGQMIAAGLDRGVIDGMIGDIGRAATAANAEFSDMASIATASVLNLKAEAGDMGGILGALVVAGKEGNFELKDMARHFAQLTPQVAKFGVTGREAVNFLGAGLQIAMKGASDPAQAANNFRNFLSKALSPDTVKRFKEMGVDIQAVMLDATAKGINPLEAMLQKVSVLTGVSEKSIAKYMATAKAQGLEGADALAFVREQLEAIGAAGQISKLFGDQQVLDFVIPFMANIDEYKRIKEKVAAATGAAIDDDFRTQMEGLNRQMIRFGEIGTQATRIVGFAFGQWMPSINDHLEAALLWIRELDKSTGGWVSQLLAIGGAGLMVATALGALGFILPIVGAGLGALAALAGVVLSPIGLLIGLLAGGAVLVSRNWDRFGPRLTRLWDRAKRAFGDFAGAVVDRGRRLVSAGRELAARYGPAVVAAMESAWDAIGNAGAGAWRLIREAWASASGWLDANWDTIRSAGVGAWDAVRDAGAAAWEVVKSASARVVEDIKGGWQGLQEFFDGLTSTIDLTPLTEKLTFDAAASEGLSALAAAMDLVAGAWDAVRDFGRGFAPWLRGIGEDLGGTISSIVGIADGIVRLVSALAGLVGVDREAAGGFFEWLGSMAGGAVRLATATIRGVAMAIDWVVNAIASLVEAIASLDWKDLVPQGVAAAWDTVASAIRGVADLLPGSVLDKPEPIMSPRALGIEDLSLQKLREDKGGAIADALDEAMEAARARREAEPMPARPTPAPVERPAAAEPVRLDGKVGVTIKVDGPGKVTGTSNSNPSQIKVGSNGRMVGSV